MVAIVRICAVVAVALAVFSGLCIQKGRPAEWELMPEILRPHRPAFYAALNGFGKFMNLEPGPVDSQEDILAAACKLANLPAGAACEFDMPGESSAEWRETFQVLHKAVKEEAGVHFFGGTAATEWFTDTLTHRLRLIHAWRNMPDLEATPIKRPVFIMGMHRTGTTLLFNLLKEIDGLRAPSRLEYLFPIPAVGKIGDKAHVAIGQAHADLLQVIMPGVDDVHNFNMDMPEECIFSMMFSMAGMIPPIIFEIPSYIQHVMKKTYDHTHVMKFHRRLLQWLQATAGDERRWVLKAPYFTMMIEDIEKLYPDALFIFTHRAPHKSVASMASLNAKYRGVFADYQNLTRIGPEQLLMHEEMMRRVLEARRRWKTDPAMSHRVFDIDMSDLAQDPVTAVGKAWEHFGLDITSDNRAKLQHWVDTQQKVTKGKHPVRLEDFGLTKEKVLASPVFREYCQEFNVPDC